MTTTVPVTRDSAGWGERLAQAAAVGGGMFWAFYTLGTAFERAGSDASPWLVWLLLGIPLVVAQPLLLLWLRRHPVRVGYAAAGASLLWPLGWVVPLLAWLGCLVLAPQRGDVVDGEEIEGGDVAIIGLIAFVGAWWVTWRDMNAVTGRESLTKLLVHSGGEGDPSQMTSDPLPWWLALVVTALTFAITGALGAALRSRREERAARRRTMRVEHELGDARSELGRQVERERIAREVHDTLGHRLSLLSVHAGALELQAEGRSDDLAASAAIVRESARQSIDELRSLVGILREAPDEVSAPSLVDLPAMIDEGITAGDPVVATVFVSGAERADETLSRAVYRIVQELLTNARKHAPGVRVRLVVNGSPDRGVTVETVNELVALPAGPPGHGLAGIRERVELLGGRVEAGVDGQLFRARAWLPWREAPAGR